MSTDDTSAEPGAWLPIPEAAAQLRYHVRTVHRKITAGELTKRELGRGRVEVWVPEYLVPDDTSELAPETPQDTSLAVMSQHMALLERQGEITAQQMAPLVEELAATRRQMAEQAEEIGRLKAELAQHVATDDRRPWWRFWRA